MELDHILFQYRGVRELFDEPDVPGVDVIGRSFDRNGELAAGIAKAGPAYLRITKEDHAGRAPIVDSVGEHIDVHEQAVSLSGQQLTPLAVNVSQAKCGLTRIDAGPEQIELEFEVDGWGVFPGW